MRTINTVLILILFLSVNSFAQSTTIKLPTADTSSFRITNNNDTQMFRLNADGGFYVGGSTDVGTVPVSGAGNRLMWFPTKYAFRVGLVNSFGSTYWDLANIGYGSAAIGENCRASGNNSFAANLATTASGDESVALGNNGTASADRTFAFNGTASAVGAVAIGSGAQATNDDALALGPSSIAGGLAAVCIGPSIANGNFGVAIGLQNSAGGQFSTAIGKNARTTHQGSMVLSDASAGFSSDSVQSRGNNSMTMRFAGGYVLFTNMQRTIGVSLAPGGSSWASVSDSTKKGNFIKADGEYFLNSLSKLRLGSWNYKTQDSKEFRHYGPMAQEIFHYFGKDKLGKIGNDTTLATADMDGIMMICLQALENRTTELQKANTENLALKQEVEELKKTLSEQNNKISAQQTMMESFRNEFYELKKAVYNQGEKKEKIEAEFTMSK